MTELKPCPFCGWHGDVVYYPRFNTYAIECGYCGERTNIYHTKDEAVEAWNRRENNVND